MTKGDLLNLLEKASNDAEIFVVTKSYDDNDDSTWMADTQSEIAKVNIDEEYDEIQIVIDCEEFD